MEESENRMIRAFEAQDMDAVLDIWLSASIKAHDFVQPAFWASQEENMRQVYLPAANIQVYVKDTTVVGFYALCENNLAALFVAPTFQGQGIGAALLNHAKKRRAVLTLSVYKDNEASCRFYWTHGFTVVSEQVDTHTGHLEYVMSTKAP